jgi:hypothetical protein
MGLDIDHIDPTWKEGRDYQLVCGLDVSLNFAERDERLNVQKSNRFLPWRVAGGELGSIPQDPGDLCQFMNPDTGEWTLAEFMGEWWMEKTKRFCGQSAGRMGIKRPDLAERNRSLKGVPRGPLSEEHRARLSAARSGQKASEEAKANMRKRRNLTEEQRERRRALSRQTAAANSRSPGGRFVKKSEG